MNPMSTAPKNKVIILVMPGGLERLADYWDCKWMRDDPGCDDVDDCWMPLGEDQMYDGTDHIELGEPVGWKPFTIEETSG